MLFSDGFEQVSNIQKETDTGAYKDFQGREVFFSGLLWWR
jgi:hypothetical protein